jgi:hypothetical protein
MSEAHFEKSSLSTQTQLNSKPAKTAFLLLQQAATAFV